MNSVKTSEFSTQYLNLQKSFCCTSGNFDLIRWVRCKPGIYNGSRTLFSSEDLSMCSWFQSVNNYAFSTIEIESSGIFEIQFMPVEFIFIRVSWPSEVLESEKILEVGINKQAGYVGSTIPFPIGIPNPPDYNYTIIKDIMLMNTVSAFGGPMKINNISKHTATVSLLYAY